MLYCEATVKTILLQAWRVPVVTVPGTDISISRVYQVISRMSCEGASVVDQKVHERVLLRANVPSGRHEEIFFHVKKTVENECIVEERAPGKGSRK